MSNFEKKENGTNKSMPKVEDSSARAAAPNSKLVLSNNLMIVQLAAYYIKYGDEVYRQAYLEKIGALGINKEEAIHIFNFECDVCKKYNKNYLLDLHYVKAWIMGLKQPFFVSYPKKQDDICKEFFLTIGELCKLIDEAEWHFWNSHEHELSDEVWEEIDMWRLCGNGGNYVVNTYLPAVCKKYSVSMDSLVKLANHYGSFLAKYRWG